MSVALRARVPYEKWHQAEKMEQMAEERQRIGFIIEQALGHITHTQNLTHWVNQDETLAPTWMEVPYEAPDLWQRIPRIPFSVKLSLRARQLARKATLRQSFDCLYFHTQALTLFSLDMMRVQPGVVSLDATPRDFKDIAQAYDATTASGVVDRIKAKWFRIIFARAAGLVAISDWVKHSLVRHYDVPAEKIRVFRYAVDINQWQPAARSTKPHRPLRLLFVGGDFTRKGGQILLEAFRAGLSEICELDIVTKERLIATERSVRVHRDLSPNTPELRQLFAQADLFVLPTRGDANGIAILEAMACGLPIISTDVGSLRELVQDGVNGYLVPRDDPKAIIDRVAYLVNRRERVIEMGAAARLSAERTFNAERSYKGLIAYLKEVGASWAETSASSQRNARS